MWGWLTMFLADWYILKTCFVSWHTYNVDLNHFPSLSFSMSCKIDILPFDNYIHCWLLKFEAECSKGRNGHVPYRDSKLTRILQSSLGGNARTAIICTLSPARSHVEQSRNTLLFASCAKEVSTNAQVNVVMSDKALVKKLQRELARLEDELKCAGTTTTSSDSSALLREKDLQIEMVNNRASSSED